MKFKDCSVVDAIADAGDLAAPNPLKILLKFKDCGVVDAIAEAGDLAAPKPLKISSKFKDCIVIGTGTIDVSIIFFNPA